MKKKNIYLFVGASLVLLCALVVVSISIGVMSRPLSETFAAFSAFNENDTYHLMVRDVRLTRTITAILVGAALAISGAMMQGITSNPMADSGLMGTSAGAGLALALCISVFKIDNYTTTIIITFIGALLSTLIVFMISKLIPGSESTLKMVLSGAIISSCFMALSQALVISADQAQNLMFWTLGSVKGVTWDKLAIFAPLIIVASTLSIFLSKKISLLSLSDDMAASLGVRVGLVKASVIVLTSILSACAFVMGGSITFVGILTAHLIRFFVGSDYRKIIPLCFLVGGLFVLGADIISRMIAPPTEYPVAAVLSIIGVPVFLYFARRS